MVVAMKLGLIDARLLIDLKDVAELADVMVDDDQIRIGATATHRYLESDPEVAAALPVLAEVERCVANARVRAVGTLGGNLAFGEPHSDPATLLAAADARYVLASSAGTERSVPATEFLLGPFESCLSTGEIMIEAAVPLRPRRVFGYQRFVLTERPAATVAVRLDVADQAVEAASVVVGAATPLPISVPTAGQLLQGAPLCLGHERLASVGAAVAESIELEHGTNARYLRHLVSTLTTRALADALARADRLPAETDRATRVPRPLRSAARLAHMFRRATS